MNCPDCGSSEVYYHRSQFVCACGYIGQASSKDYDKWSNDGLKVFKEECQIEDFKEELDAFGNRRQN